jgi:3-(3-hydroxy-phenyl)propionate hydroxylase
VPSSAASAGSFLKERYLGATGSAVYLIRPDQHVATRWQEYDEAAVEAALLKATGRKKRICAADAEDLPSFLEGEVLP